MQALCDCGGVDEVAVADLAGDHFVEGAQLALALHWVVHLGGSDVVVTNDDQRAGLDLLADRTGLKNKNKRSQIFVVEFSTARGRRTFSSREIQNL